DQAPDDRRTFLEARWRWCVGFLELCLHVHEELLDFIPAQTRCERVGPPALRVGPLPARCLTGFTALGVKAVVIFFGQLAALKALDDVVDGCIGGVHCTMGGGERCLGFGYGEGIAFLGEAHVAQQSLAVLQSSCAPSCRRASASRP